MRVPWSACRDSRAQTRAANRRSDRAKRPTTWSRNRRGRDYGRSQMFGSIPSRAGIRVVQSKYYRISSTSGSARTDGTSFLKLPAQDALNNWLIQIKTQARFCDVKGRRKDIILSYGATGIWSFKCVLWGRAGTCEMFGVSKGRTRTIKNVYDVGQCSSELVVDLKRSLFMTLCAETLHDQKVQESQW